MNESAQVWLTIKGAAQHIGMSTAFLRKMVRGGRMPYVRIGSKALRFNREALDAWLKAKGCDGEVNHVGRG